MGFWIKGRTGDTVQVGTIGSPSNISSFSVNSTVVLDGDDWIPVAVDLQGVPAGRERVAIRVARIDGFAVCTQAGSAAAHQIQVLCSVEDVHLLLVEFEAAPEPFCSQ